MNRGVESGGQRKDLWGAWRTSGYLGENDRVQHLWRHGCWNVSELHSKTGVRGNADLGLTDWAGQLCVCLRSAQVFMFVASILILFIIPLWHL
jgi:hypothetical protein